MSYYLDLTLGALPLTPNKLLGAHWRVRAGEAKKWERIVFAHTIKSKPPQPLTLARIELTRYSSGRLDADGLRGSFKAILDALCKCGIIKDDNMGVIGEPAVKHVKVGPRQGKIRVQVWEVAQAPLSVSSTSLSI